jgi:hypothetical protein
MTRAEWRKCGAALMLGLTIGIAPAPVRAAEPSPARQEYGPDPASVRRYGPAYRYPRAGWIVLHIEGEPYDRGYQHGRLLAPEIASYLRTLAAQRSPKAPGPAWQAVRTLVDALFLRRYDKEYLEEMKGTADGASAAGATFEGRPIDLLDIAAINSEIEVSFLQSALEATAHGLESKAFTEPSAAREKAPHPEHCSAFAATGPATEGGQVVIGHITMWNLETAGYLNIWLDVKPTQGHRVLMQTYPGGIQSGQDYYQNDAGLVVCETTIEQTRFEPEGQALASRIRQALQYADSIDTAIAILGRKNNGLYTNEWLLADTKTGEIAMFELGTQKTRLWRSSKDEWFGGTKGFYWGCNNAKDLDVRLETIAAVDARPANLVFRPTDRDLAWLKLFDQFQGKINADFGFKAFTTPPLAAHPSLDAKFTTTALAKELKSHALFGPPLGQAWIPTTAQSHKLETIKPLIPNDWTLLSAEAPAPASDDLRPSVDLSGMGTGYADPGSVQGRTPAWHGTILPRTDADTWLAAAFADYEPIVAFEEAHASTAETSPVLEKIELALGGARSRYHAAVRRLGRDIPLNQTRATVRNAEWYEIAAGKGVLLLAALRDQVGKDKFKTLMDEFGRAHAGHAVDVAQFRAHAQKATGKPLGGFFLRWTEQEGLIDGRGDGTWAVDSFEAEPEKALIVYGTVKDVHAQREAGTRLQHAIASRWSNVTVPIKPDTELTDDDWKTHHVLLVGRPEANSAAVRALKNLPVGFGPTSFTVKGETYGHAGSAVIAAGENPLNPRFEVVIFAGLGAEATWHCVEASFARSEHPEVVILAEASSPRLLNVSASVAKAKGAEAQAGE